MLRGEVGEGGAAGEDLGAELAEARGGVGARGGGDDPALRVLPGRLAPGPLVLPRRRRRRPPASGLLAAGQLAPPLHHEVEHREPHHGVPEEGRDR